MCPSVAIGPPLLKHRNPILCHGAVKWGCVWVCLYMCVFRVSLIGVCLQRVRAHRLNACVSLLILSVSQRPPLLKLFVCFYPGWTNVNISEAPKWCLTAWLPDCLTLFGCFHTHEEISAELTGVSVSRLNKVSLFMFYSRPVSLLHSSISLLPFLLIWPVLYLLDTWSFLIPVCDSTWCCDSRHDQDTRTHWVGVHRQTVSPAQKLLWESYTEIHTGYVIRLVCVYICEYVYVFDMVTLYVLIRSLYLLGFRTGPSQHQSIDPERVWQSFNKPRLTKHK